MNRVLIYIAALQTPSLIQVLFVFLNNVATIVLTKTACSLTPQNNCQVFRHIWKFTINAYLFVSSRGMLIWVGGYWINFHRFVIYFVLQNHYRSGRIPRSEILAAVAHVKCEHELKCPTYDFVIPFTLKITTRPLLTHFNKLKGFCYHSMDHI